MRGIFFSLIFAILSFAQAQPRVTIDAVKIQSVLKNGSTVVTVPVESTYEAGIRASLSLSWLDWQDLMSKPVDQVVTIQPGRTILEVPLQLVSSSIWTRLRYSLIPDGNQARAFPPLNGRVSISQIAPYIFELKINSASEPRRGRPITVNAQAIHPATRTPVEGVVFQAILTIDEKEFTPVRSLNQGDGLVEFTFNLPASLDGDLLANADVDVTAINGDFEQSTSLNLNFPTQQRSGRFQTDKPIYQPGQTIHLRAIVLDPQGRAANGAKVTVRIEDAENDRVHTASLVSSRFGVVQQDWTLPETATLGIYRLTLLAEGDNDYQMAQHSVRVSRYELPTFNVVAKPDRTAYLPDQPVEVKVSGTFLFGKPVPKGHVKIIREDEDGPAAEGDAGADGIFIAKLDLKEDKEDLQKNEFKHFRDIHFSAYLTDPLSGRTEQRRFDVRLTRKPIHVHFLNASQDFGFVSTSYADGKPAQANVEILLEGKRVATVRTNRYGLVRYVFPTVEGRYFEIEALVKDDNGLTGNQTFRHPLSEFPRIKLTPRHTLHRTGESVTLQINASQLDAPDAFVIIHAVSDGQSVARRIVRLADRKGEVTFSYQPAFRRTVTFTAWNISYPKGINSKSVIFPDGSDLHLSATTEKAVYKPGEKATLTMQVNSADGKPVEAALGLAIVDQAVLERARTDDEFGQRPWFSCAFCKTNGESEIGGVRLNDLYLLKPATIITPALDLVAEALLSDQESTVAFDDSERMEDTPPFKSIGIQMGMISALLEKHYMQEFEFPKDLSTLTRILGNQWFTMQDPWGSQFTAKFSVDYSNYNLEIVSIGPDKVAGTKDDFVAGSFQKPFFTAMRLMIENILNKQDDYPPNASEFKNLLSQNGILLDTLRDPWGTPYKAHVNTWGASRNISIITAGPDLKFGTEDYPVANFIGGYFHRQRAQIAEALSSATNPPKTEEQFRKLLDSTGIDISLYRDAWGNPYRLTSESSSRFEDSIKTTTVRVFGGALTPRKTITPVTRRFIAFSLRSAGSDAIVGNGDDFDIVRFPILISEESTAVVSNPPPAANIGRGTGVLAGKVYDQSGAAIPRVKMTLFSNQLKFYETATNPVGNFVFRDLPAGIYTLLAEAAGFKPFETIQIPVTDAKSTTVNCELEIGSLNETVTVTSAPPMLQTSVSMASGVSAASTGTPRVRDYFPETLVWLPEILTDARGTARTQFTLADSVTNWKVAVIASTLDGRIVETESDLRSFQPFFLEFNPPPILTEGDQLELPVTVRNYLNTTQKAEITIAPNNWSTLQGSKGRVMELPANSSANVSFSVKAIASKEKATQRISAIAGPNRDAIEKAVRVHPDGQEVTHTSGDLILNRTAFNVLIATNAIAGGTHGELRIYPNIATILLESASAILITPYGCAEQTISAGYSNLVAWRFAKAAGITDPKIEKVALANIRKAIEKLSLFKNSTGGIGYWSRENADVAVTAHALSFLIEAGKTLPVEKDDMQMLATWIEKQQASDGTWPSRVPLVQTSLVLRSLASAQKAGLTINPKVLTGAYHHIARFTDSIDEPYMLANFILAALQTGDEILLGNALPRLQSLAREEKGGIFWDLRTNTPFNGWGTSGRHETTSMVVSALAAWRTKYPQATDLDPLIRRGLLFLMRGRDQWGGWFSTQSTLRAMQAIADASDALGNFGGKGGQMEIRVGGRLVKKVAIPIDPKATNPILVDVSSFLTSGQNEIELVSSAGANSSFLRFWSTHWLPWTQTNPRISPELRLAVKFNQLTAAVGEPIQCTVQAERVGFRGYGMMMAEIGLPPGVEVDRESLEEVVSGGKGINRYEVFPDHVAFYLWPTAGGVSFDFTFRARMAMTAKSAASVLYDYYNPEVRAEVAPILVQSTSK